METSPQNPSVSAIGSAPRRPGNYLLPLLVLVLALVPLVRLASSAFGFGSTESAGWRELNDTLHNRAHLQSLATWLVLSSLMTLTITVIATFAGYMMSRSFRRAAPGRSDTAALTALFGGAILLLPFYLQASAFGALHRDIAFLLVYAFVTLPFCTWRLKLAADAVPSVILEAARIDGCSPAQSFRLILLPSLGRALMLSAIFCFMSAWNFVVFREVHSQLPVAAAMLLLSIPLLIVFLLLNRKPAQ